MKGISISIAIIVFSVLLVFAGLSGKQILFINGPRSATITLGAVGFFLCMLAVGKFVSKAPFHPLTIIGYILGAIALPTLLTQIFQWKIPFIGDAKTALYVLAACMIIKSVIGCFAKFLR
jgi:hypothetical protein